MRASLDSSSDLSQLENRAFDKIIEAQAHLGLILLPHSGAKPFLDWRSIFFRPAGLLPTHQSCFLSSNW